jgi:hypothetical protein
MYKEHIIHTHTYIHTYIRTRGPQNNAFSTYLYNGPTTYFGIDAMYIYTHTHTHTHIHHVIRSSLSFIHVLPTEPSRTSVRSVIGTMLIADPRQRSGEMLAKLLPTSFLFKRRLCHITRHVRSSATWKRQSDRGFSLHIDYIRPSDVKSSADR